MQPSIQEMSSSLDGMFWKPSETPLSVPSAGEAGMAVCCFEQNFAEIVWNNLASLENLPLTLEHARAMLSGASPEGLEKTVRQQARNMIDALRSMLELVLSGEFQLDETTARRLHAFLGRDAPAEWPLFSPKGERGHMPPPREDFSAVLEKGLLFLRERIENPAERAFAAFLFISRCSFFRGSDRRTAVVMMNGALLKAELFPVVVLAHDAERFRLCFSAFLESGDATDMMDFFRQTVKKLYG